MNTNLKLSRREFLLSSAALGGSALFGVQPAFSAGVEWKRFAGTTIEVNLTKNPRGEWIVRNLPEFEALTGIKVNAEATPEQQQRQKTTIELSSGKPSFDVIHLSYHVQKRQFEKGGWLADLTGFFKDPTLTDPSMTAEDFGQAGWMFANDTQGHLHSLPFSVDYWILYWNKELFDKKGLRYPQTFDEMVDAAEALTDKASGTYGFAARGLKNANVPVWTSLMLGCGTSAIGPDGKILADSEEAVQAAKYYQRLMAKSAPPGVSGFNWAEAQSAFLQGKIGMWLDGVGFAPPIEDPTKSRVVGKAGYGVMPRGPKDQAAATTGDGIGVTARSTKQGAAYFFCQWVASHKMGAGLLQTGSGVPFRNSIVSDPEVRKGVKMPEGWLDAVIGSGKISKLSLPVIIPVTEFRDIYGVALTNMIDGADPADELKKATAQFAPVLAKSEA